jgi:hypothetical protein
LSLAGPTRSEIEPGGHWMLPFNVEPDTDDSPHLLGHRAVRPADGRSLDDPV